MLLIVGSISTKKIVFTCCNFIFNICIHKAFDLITIVLHVKLWCSHVTGKLLLNLMDHTEVVRDLTFAPDGSLILVSASRDKTLRVWDLKDDGNVWTLSALMPERSIHVLSSFIALDSIWSGLLKNCLLVTHSALGIL